MLAVDAGERRVGLAISDETRLLAAPLRVLRRDRGLKPVLDEIATVVREGEVTQVVIGLPLNEDGTRGRQAHRAERFALLLQRLLHVPVEMWDERLSTLEAEAVIRSQGRSTRLMRQRGEVDAVAAAVILQDYLDALGRDAARTRSPGTD